MTNRTPRYDPDSDDVIEADTTSFGGQGPSFYAAQTDLHSRFTSSEVLDSIDGSQINPSGVSVGGSAMQAALDGKVVPIAPGLGVNDAISLSDSTTPIQDAVDLVNDVADSLESKVVGAGTILLPPGEIDSEGEIWGIGGMRILGQGWESTVIKISDLSANAFALGSFKSSQHMFMLDGFAIDGVDKLNRTGGCAIDYSATPADATGETGSSTGSNMGHIVFERWGGPDPVIYGPGPFSSHWEFLWGRNNRGTFIEAPAFFDNSINHLYYESEEPNSWVVDITSGQNGRIGSINCGGNVGKLFRADLKEHPMASLRVDYMNAEPNAAYTPDITGGVVELSGKTPTRIGHLSLQNRVNPDYAVGLTQSPHQNLRGPGNKIFQSIDKGNAPYAISVESGPYEPSYYFGPQSEVNYNGFERSAVIPLANAFQMQSLGNVSGSRSLNTWYTNDTGKPLSVQAYAEDPAGGRLALVMNISAATDTSDVVSSNSDAGNGTNGTYVSVSGIVPPLDNYRIYGSEVDQWWESTIG